MGSRSPVRQRESGDLEAVRRQSPTATRSYLAYVSRKYKFTEPEGLYFISFATVGWIDVLTRREYKDIVVESLG